MQLRFDRYMATDCEARVDVSGLAEGTVITNFLLILHPC